MAQVFAHLDPAPARLLQDQEQHVRRQRQLDGVAVALGYVAGAGNSSGSGFTAVGPRVERRLTPKNGVSVGGT